MSVQDEGVGSGPNAAGYGDMPHSMVDTVKGETPPVREWKMRG